MRLFYFLALLLPLCAFGQDNEGLGTELATVYRGWRTAIVQRDLAAWKKWTAEPRQALTRNLIISQKKRFPEAMFSSSSAPPDVSGLRLLSARAKGPTATAIYHGAVGPGGEGLMIQRFFRGPDGWKYDSLALMNLPAQAKADIKVGKLGFLNEPEFQPSGELPLTPKPCPTPDFIADVHIVALGFKAAVDINGVSSHLADNAPSTELVIGGLRRGKNKIAIRTKALAEAPGDKKQCKVTVYAKTGNPAKPAVKVFEFAPNPVPATHTAEFTVDPATLSAK